MMNETLNTIENLRSVRIFDDRKISEEDMKTILDHAVKAATASHRQAYTIIDIDDEELIWSLWGNHAGRALLFCADNFRLQQLAEMRKVPYPNSRLGELHSALIDTILAAQTAVIAARSMGIDSVIHHSLQAKNLDVLYETFNLPRQKFFPVMTVILGYAEDQETQGKGRIKGEGIVHKNRYTPLDIEALNRIFLRYDNKDERMGYISDWEDKGYEHYMDWYLNVWNGRGTDDIEKTEDVLNKLLETDYLSSAIISDLNR